MIKRMLQEYKDFINKGDVVLVAVGLVMALYFKAIVDQIIAAVITPLVSLVFNAKDIESIDFFINDTQFPIGLVLKAIIDFLAVAFVLFFVVKAYNAWKRSPEEEAKPTEVELLTEIRDALRTRP